MRIYGSKGSHGDYLYILEACACTYYDIYESEHETMHPHLGGLCRFRAQSVYQSPNRSLSYPRFLDGQSCKLTTTPVKSLAGNPYATALVIPSCREGPTSASNVEAREGRKPTFLPFSLVNRDLRWLRAKPSSLSPYPLP